MQVILVVGIRKRSFVLDFQKKLMEVLSFFKKRKTQENTRQNSYSLLDLWSHFSP